MLRWWIMLWLRRSPQLAEAYRDMRNRKLESSKFEFHLSELLLFLAALAVGVCYVIFHPSLVLGNTNVGGLGFFLSQLLILGVGLATVVMRKQLRALVNGWNIATFACTLLLGLSYVLYSNQLLRRINFIPLVVLTFASLRAMTNVDGNRPFVAGAAWEGFSRLLTGVYKYATVPFRALATLGGKKEKSGPEDWDESQFGIPVLGMILVFMLAVIGTILIVFSVSGMMAKVMDAFMKVRVRTLLLIIGFIIMPFVLFSLTYAATHARTDTVPVTRFRLPIGLYGAGWAMMALASVGLLVYWLLIQERRAEPLPFVTLTLYALFAFLFNALMLSTAPAARGVHLLAAVGTALALFFDVYAFIQTLGQLDDRIVTIAMFLMQPLLAVLLAMQLVRFIFSKVRINQWAAGFLLFGWTLVNVLNVSSLVGGIFIDASQSFGVPIDANFLIMMGPDVLPALNKVQDEAVREELKQKMGSAWSTRVPVTYDWGFAWAGLEKRVDLTPPKDYVPIEKKNPTLWEASAGLMTKMSKMFNRTDEGAGTETEGPEDSPAALDEGSTDFMSQLLMSVLLGSMGDANDLGSSGLSQEDLPAVLNPSEDGLAAMETEESPAQEDIEALPAATAPIEEPVAPSETPSIE